MCVSLLSRKGQGLRTGPCPIHPKSPYQERAQRVDTGDLHSALTPTQCLWATGGHCTSQWVPAEPLLGQGWMGLLGASTGCSTAEHGAASVDATAPSSPSEVGLKLQHGHQGRKVTHRRKSRRPTRSVQGQHWTDRKKGRACHPQEEKQQPLATVSLQLLDFVAFF